MTNSLRERRYAGSVDSATLSMPRTSKKEQKDAFAKRLIELREARGMTQAELSRATGISERMIAYYERPDAKPPGSLLATLARALQVTTDELLGLQPTDHKRPVRSSRLVRRLSMIEKLPPDDQRAVLKFLDALLEKHGFPPSAAARQGHRAR